MKTKNGKGEGKTHRWKGVTGVGYQHTGFANSTIPHSDALYESRRAHLRLVGTSRCLAGATAAAAPDLFHAPLRTPRRNGKPSCSPCKLNLASSTSDTRKQATSIPLTSPFQRPSLDQSGRC